MVFVLFAIGFILMIVIVIKEAIWPPKPSSYSDLSFMWKIAFWVFIAWGISPFLFATYSDTASILKIAWFAVTGEYK